MTTETTNETRRKDDARPTIGLTWADPAPAAEHIVDVMIDLETLGTTPGSAILSIGAVMFGPAGLGDEFYAPIALASCTAVGLTIDPATVAWWMKQSDAARAAAFRDDAEPLPVVLQQFTCWFELVEAEKPWCQGANFDAPLLEAAYRACGMTPPWKFWNVRDTRTLYELADVKVDRARGVHHNALDDARAQAEAAVVALQRLQDVHVRSAAAGMSDLPPLPRPAHRGPDGTGSYFDAYTADQMYRYAHEHADNTPWLRLAHIICADAGIPPGRIDDRLEALRDKLGAGRAAAASAGDLWQPIETVPRNMASRLYLVGGFCVQGFVDVTGQLMVQSEVSPHWREMRGKPTHWMPLPDTRAAAKGAAGQDGAA